MRALAVAVLIGLAACGEKVPQSQAAKDVGNQPKQSVEKAATDAAAAVQQGAERTREADSKSGN